MKRNQTKMNIEQQQHTILHNGFTVINNIFSAEEITQILTIIDLADTSSSTFRKSADLFAIRQFLKEIPDVQKLIFNAKLDKLIAELFGQNYFVTK